MTERITEGAAGLLERRTSRRGVLARAALVASALAARPLHFLLRPGTAWAAIGPGSCSGGLCTDGYTAFCCEINHASNTCPPHTYIAGWWKCTAYRGHGLCDREGVRYIVDCNHFRYGQCNTQVSGTTEVACRLIVCQNPSQIPGFNCNSSLKVDDTTCSHEAGCLDQAEQLGDGGGA